MSRWPIVSDAERCRYGLPHRHPEAVMPWTRPSDRLQQGDGHAGLTVVGVKAGGTDLGFQVQMCHA
jgi:hypothetical protein